MHGDRKNQAKSLINQISNKIPENIDKKLFTERISPTLGCHVGPSVYAFATVSGDVLDI
jgi:fatty acid-binding protein DegV